METFAALDLATVEFARTLALVRTAQWEGSTPNQGWNVRDLVNHVVGGNRRYVLLLTGAPTEEVEALRDLDHLTDDPYADFVSTAAEVAAAFRQPGALDRTVHHRWGDRSGSQLLYMRISEHALHGWDLARAIGADETIDTGVANALVAAIDADPALISPGAFSPLPDNPALSNVERLLALTGRS